ncbi:hypothetical protein M8C21_028522 [Ambrosia artemisiifolia]|uniref:Uncharacterized protein n=1 Tax=Ambrosia artemisiifolia TaxID=4212 RepID=A0AAD5GQ93_AMBAR|nr:hypothetical protein M8C21_028522 [Ambrosia artemisiifolia]
MDFSSCIDFTNVGFGPKTFRVDPYGDVGRWLLDLSLINSHHQNKT